MGMHHFLDHQPYGIIGLNNNKISPFLGLILAVSGILILMAGKKLKNGAFFLLIPAVIIVLHSICKFIESGYVIEQLVEFATKILLPIVLLKETRKPTKEKNMQLVLKIIVALTFIGHGLFALGFHYVPGSFIRMTHNILGLSIHHSHNFLLVIGVLDVVLAILLFSKNRQVQQVTLIYLILWGALTSLARLVFPMVIEADPTQLGAGFAGMVYRLPHALIPFWLMLQLVRVNVQLPQLIKG
jgi:hypothetical protein